MGNEGRVFTIYFCKGNVGKERPIPATVLWGAGRTPRQGEECWGGGFSQHRQDKKKKPRALNLDCVGKNTVGAEGII